METNKKLIVFAFRPTLKYLCFPLPDPIKKRRVGLSVKKKFLTLNKDNEFQNVIKISVPPKCSKQCLI